MAHANLHASERRASRRFDNCTDLGRVTINGATAELYVCDGLAIARFGDAPGEVEAAHLHSLDATSSPFLLVAFRLYLDAAETHRVDRPASPVSAAAAALRG